MLPWLLSLFLLLAGPASAQLEIKWDPKGYVMFSAHLKSLAYKVDSVLGMLDFAKQLDRTLIVPNIMKRGDAHVGGWRGHHTKDWHHPYGENFDPQRLGLYHRVIELDTFMEQLAERHWPLNKRIKFCKGKLKCKFNDEMWREEAYRVKWIGEEKMESFEVPYLKENFPPEKYPVLTFPVAHTSLPLMKPKERRLYSYLDFAQKVKQNARDFIASHLSSPFLAVHLRTGRGFDKVCSSHVGNTGQFYNLEQCLTPGEEPLMQNMCVPDDDYIAYVIVKAAERFKSRSVFMAVDHWRSNLKERIEMGLSQLPLRPRMGIQQGDRFRVDPVMDIAIMSYADNWIGNCVSSFSGITNRIRQSNRLPSEYMGMGANDPSEEEVESFALYNNRLINRRRGHDEL